MALPERILALQAAEIAPQLSPEWFRVRQQELFSATDVAALLHLDPYKTREKVLAVKSGQAGDDFKGNVFTDHGRNHEAVLRAIHEHVGGEPVDALGLIRHPRLPFIGASPDGIGRQSLKLKEFKCPLRRKLEAGTVPISYWVQIQVQLQVCALEQAQYIEAYIGSRPCPPPTEQDVRDTPAWPALPGDTVYWTVTDIPFQGWFAMVQGEGVYSMSPHAADQVQELRALIGARPAQWFRWTCDAYHHTPVVRDEAWWQEKEPLLVGSWHEVVRRRNGPMLPPPLPVKTVRVQVPRGLLFLPEEDTSKFLPEE